MRTAAQVVGVREDCECDAAVSGESAITIGRPEPLPEILFLDEVPQPVGAEPRGRRKKLLLRVIPGALAAALAVAGLAAAPSAIQRERSRHCRGNIERIGQALLDYQRDHGALPPAVVAGPEGQPLLSWRVAILPYLGRRDLYDQFRFDEPWDGPHNAALLAKMPEVFACPSDGRCLKYCRTPYLVIVGPEANEQMGKPLFERTRRVDEREILDGVFQTLMVTEASRLVPWTMPDDLYYEPDGPLPQFGERHGGTFNVVYADARAASWPRGRTEAILRGAITRDGNEILGA